MASRAGGRQRVLSSDACHADFYRLRIRHSGPRSRKSGRSAVGRQRTRLSVEAGRITFTNCAVQVPIAAILATVIRGDRISTDGAGRERIKLKSDDDRRESGRVRTGSAQFRRPTRMAAAAAVQAHLATPSVVFADPMLGSAFCCWQGQRRGAVHWGDSRPFLRIFVNFRARFPSISAGRTVSMCLIGETGLEGRVCSEDPPSY